MVPLTFDAPNHDVEYERNTELGRQADVAGDVVLNTPPTTWGDIVGLASIVAHEAGHDLDALGPRRTKDGDPGPIAAEMLALAVLRLHAMAVPQLVPVDVELVRLISAWREQRDIIDRTAVETAGIESRLPRRSPARRRKRHAISQSKSGNAPRLRRGAEGRSTR
jgi:hypothetical protein